MNAQTEVDFDFKKLKNDTTTIEQEEESFSHIFCEIFVRNFVTVSSYIITSILMFKAVSIDLMLLAYSLSKIVLTLSAIGQALKYLNKKSLKFQLFNGALHTGLLVYLFKYDGFFSVMNFIKQALNVFLI